MIEPSLQLGGGNWANKSDSLLGYHKDGANFYADELTFSRNTLGSYTDANGLIQSMPYNLLSYSEDFNAGWSLIGGGSFTSNAATAPNGTTTADEYDLGGYVRQLLTIPANYITFTLYVRAKTSSASFRVGILGVGDSAIAQTIETVDTSWFRMSVTYDNTSDLAKGVFFNIQSGDSEVYIWGAQVNIGSTALPYFPTTTRLNLARVDYKDNVNGSLLLEPQRTNLVTYSEQFDNAAWGASAGGFVRTANATIAPDGTMSADRIQFPTVDTFLIQNTSLTAGTACAGSVYVKGTAGQTFSIAPGGIDRAPFTLNGEWQRITHTATAATDFILLGPISGSNATDVFLWGCQLEAGSYVSSYIPTLASSVTRLADTAYKTGISSLIGQTEGVIFADVTIPTMANTGGNLVIMSLFNGALTNATVFDVYDTGDLLAYHINGTTQAFFTKSSFTIGRHKIAFAYKANDFAFYVDGVLVGTDTSGTIGAQDSFGLQYGANQFIGQQYVNQALLFKTRLTNTELATLTTL